MVVVVPKMKHTLRIWILYSETVPWSRGIPPRHRTRTACLVPEQRVCAARAAHMAHAGGAEHNGTHGPRGDLSFVSIVFAGRTIRPKLTAKPQKDGEAKSDAYSEQLQPSKN